MPMLIFCHFCIFNFWSSLPWRVILNGPILSIVKAKQDASRGKVFTKYIREIVTAAKLGGADPASNLAFVLLSKKRFLST